MTDRESIVVYLEREADNIKEDDGPPGCNDMKAAMRTAYRSIAHQIECCADLKPAKPKATIADLLTLHDLDLGALAHKVGVTGDGFTTAHVETLCGAFPIEPEQLALMVWNSLCDGPGDWGNSAQVVATRGSKVRAALSAPTIKVATPRVLQSADEAPCGALIKDVSDGNYTLRLVDGRGFHVRRYSGAGVDSLPVRGGGAWLWAGSIRNIRGAVEVIAEGLTEAECRHLSSLTAADALAWCERRK